MTEPPTPSAEPSPFAGELARAIVANPFCKAMGMELVSIGPGRASMKVPYRANLAGGPSGVIASGVVTTLLDNACGAAAGLALKTLSFVATINLRLDYMRAAAPGLDIIGEAECYKLTRNVAFVRGVAFEHHRGDPVAYCVSAFMINPIPSQLTQGATS
jgi:uncharacterized protein (TIGR00369 family)